MYPLQLFCDQEKPATSSHEEASCQRRDAKTSVTCALTADTQVKSINNTKTLQNIHSSIHADVCPMYYASTITLCLMSWSATWIFEMLKYEETFLVQQKMKIQTCALTTDPQVKCINKTKTLQNTHSSIHADGVWPMQITIALWFMSWRATSILTISKN